MRSKKLLTPTSLYKKDEIIVRVNLHDGLFLFFRAVDVFHCGKFIQAFIIQADSTVNMEGCESGKIFQRGKIFDLPADEIQVCESGELDITDFQRGGIISTEEERGKIRKNIEGGQRESFGVMKLQGFQI